MQSFRTRSASVGCGLLQDDQLLRRPTYDVSHCLMYVWHGNCHHAGLAVAAALSPMLIDTGFAYHVVLPSVIQALHHPRSLAKCAPAVMPWRPVGHTAVCMCCSCYSDLPTVPIPAVHFLDDGHVVPRRLCNRRIPVQLRRHNVLLQRHQQPDHPPAHPVAVFLGPRRWVWHPCTAPTHGPPC
jgi:hypothetical protein